MRHAPPEFDLARCLALSDVVVSAVPSATYKVPTAGLKDGCVCVNVAADKNFGADVREKVRLGRQFLFVVLLCCACSAGVAVYSRCGESDHSDAPAQSVRGSCFKPPLGSLIRFKRLRLLQYQDLLKEAP